MLNKVIKILKDNIFIVVILSVFFCLSVINSVCNMGLIEDGVHHFWEAITSGNIFLGHEGINSFPYNSRYFPSIFSHLITGVFVLSGVVKIKFLLTIFTFISYFIPVILLYCVYLNINNNRKYIFEFILLSFLLEFLFLNYQIWTENFITGMFLWNVFVIYLCSDFSRLSKINLISLIVFPSFLISSHPMVVVFIPFLLIYAIYKHYVNKGNICKKNNIFLIVSYILLFIAFVFNIYFIINPIFAAANEYLNMSLFKNINVVKPFLFVILLFVLTSIKLKNKIIKNLIYIIFLVVIFNSLFFNIEPNKSYVYRVLGFYIPLFFMIILFLITTFKTVYETIYFRILNILLLFVFVFNSVFYADLWNKFCLMSTNYLQENKYINIGYNDSYQLFTSQPQMFNLYHVHLYPIFIILLENMNGKNIECKINLSVPDDDMANFYNLNVFNREKQLKNFSIELNKIISMQQIK